MWGNGACLTSVASFDFGRFVAAWVTGSCQTVFVWFHYLMFSCSTCSWHFSSWYVRSLYSFYFDKWSWKNIDFWKMFVWTSGHQQGQGAAVPFSSSTACEKNEKTEKQSKYTRAHRSCEFNFWTLGTLGFQTYVICFVPSQVLEIVICLCSCYSHLGPLS